MGVYELSAVKGNGAPRFDRRLAGGGKQYLYRKSDGAWMVVDDESYITQNMGPIRSSRASRKHHRGTAPRASRAHRPK